MTLASSPSVAVVGAGRAGSHLFWALRGSGWTASLCRRGDVVPAADVTVLAVRDAEIEPTAVALGRRAGVLAHLSGALGPVGAVRLALHPAMTFPTPAAGPVSLDGVGFALTAADEEAAWWGRRIVASLGGVCVEIGADARSLYHAACSLASNVLVALEEAAAAAASRAGIPDPRSFLGPLVATTVENWRRSGREALSGPVVRGDDATVARHLATLDGPARDVYAAGVAVAKAMVGR